ncbi:LAFA_0E20296g1_1 [Lachancea sp. 'fantastica']|nr:LAFA_0E20296g1_1 [Lachancea sp. 'fantastica']
MTESQTQQQTVQTTTAEPVTAQNEASQQTLQQSPIESSEQQSVSSELQNPSATSSETQQQTENSENNEAAITPANATRGGRETSDRILYVGNLDLSVTDGMLRQYFQVGGPISNVKILMDKNNKSANYAFVEFEKPHDASVAFETLDGRQIENNVVKINWAFQSQQVSSDDTYNLFVGDLSVDVDDETLANTFKSFPSFIQAHVMWDMQTGRSRGYGFVSFGEQSQAQKAMEHNQGAVVNGRAIRVNWASKREQNINSHNSNHNSHNNGYPLNSRGFGPRRGGHRGGNQYRGPMVPVGVPGAPHGGPMGAMGMPPNAMPQPQGPVMLPQLPPQAVEAMVSSAPVRITTVYIGNISHFASEQDLIPLLQNFGFIVDFKHYADRGCCFVKYGTHEQAAVCILSLGNFPFQGRNLRTGWGKEKPTYVAQPRPEAMGYAVGQPMPMEQESTFQSSAQPMSIIPGEDQNEFQ